MSAVLPAPPSGAHLLPRSGRAPLALQGRPVARHVLPPGHDGAATLTLYRAEEGWALALAFRPSDGPAREEAAVARTLPELAEGLLALTGDLAAPEPGRPARSLGALTRDLRRRSLADRLAALAGEALADWARLDPALADRADPEAVPGRRA